MSARLHAGRIAASLRDTAGSVRYFARGYRWAAGLGPPPSPPAPSRSGPTGHLEAYFDAYEEGPGLFKWRHYFDVYERHLSRFRGRPVRMVEIGVFGGGSTRMWRDYLGEESHIVGIDIDPACRELASEGVEIRIGDQADRSFWEDFLRSEPAIDIVLDDGGHTAEQQTVTLEALLPHVSPGGVYMCEDIHGPFHGFHSFVDGLSRPLNAIGTPDRENPANDLHRHVAAVHRYPLLTVIEKPMWVAPRFEAPRHGSEWPEWAAEDARSAESRAASARTPGARSSGASQMPRGRGGD